MPHRLRWLLVAAVLTGCLPDDPPPAVELDLYDKNVSCDETTATCHASGVPVRPEYHRVPVRLRELPVSAGYPRGALMISFVLNRPSGRVAHVELEIPVDVTSPSAPPRASFVESGAGRPAFDAHRAGGRVEISWDRGCACQTGRFELVFIEPGPDGALDTADDGQRRLSRGRLRRGSRPFCHGRSILPVKPELLVVGARTCPTRRIGGGGGACAWGGSGWAVGWNDDGWYDEEWDGEWDGGGFDDGWEDEEWTDESWQDGCEPCDDGWFGGGDSGGGWGNPSGGWGDDDWGDDDWGDDDWGDDWWDDGSSDSGDDGWDDGGWDSGDDGGDDWGDDWWED